MEEMDWMNNADYAYLATAEMVNKLHEKDAEIEQLKAENERLEADNKQLKEVINWLDIGKVKAENERLKAESKREYFAVQVLNGILSSRGLQEALNADRTNWHEEAVRHADELIKALVSDNQIK